MAVRSLSSQTQKWLIEAMKALHLSARSTHRCLAVARTPSDLKGSVAVSLEGSAPVPLEHLNIAVGLREAPMEPTRCGLSDCYRPCSPLPI